MRGGVGFAFVTGGVAFLSAILACNLLTGASSLETCAGDCGQLGPNANEGGPVTDDGAVGNGGGGEGQLRRGVQRRQVRGVAELSQSRRRGLRSEQRELLCDRDGAR